MRPLYRAVGVAALAFAVPASLAGEPADAPGGPQLTPVGAERAGNADGTIPPWTGGITEPPASYQPGKTHTDPFEGDEPRFAITAANAEQYADRLTDGQLELLRAHPDTWRMNVYETRRSASYPDWIYEALEQNAKEAELVLEGKGTVRNSWGGSPFPVPKSGIEVVWNHLLRFRGVRVSRTNGFAAVTRSGNYTLVLQAQELAFPRSFPRDSSMWSRFQTAVFILKAKTFEPALLSGDGSLVIEPLDQTDSPRKAWAYVRNLRRVVRLPYFAYDFPAPNSDGLRTIDDAELYNGSPDRFDWKLLGKREVYVPYNSYRLHARDLSYDELLQKHHISPDEARYELHRVWVVEGTLREGERHVYSKRILYVDEDSWQVALADAWDDKGELWRHGEAHAINYYDVPLWWDTLLLHYDFEEERYLAVGLDNKRRTYQFSDKADPREFSPNALNYYIR